MSVDLFFFGENMNQEMHPFKDWDKQVNLLSDRHNIIVSSQISAQEILKNYSYYTLVNGYQRALESTANSEIFMDGIDIETIGYIQLIESHLSSDLLHHIITIEKKIKTIFQHEISKKFGTLQDDYLNLSNYITKERYDRKNVISQLKNVANNDRRVSESLKKYRREGNVPPWILVNDLTFGQLERWYTISQEDIKQKVVSEFNLHFDDEEKDRESFRLIFLFLIAFRNGLAHGDVINKISPRVIIHYWIWKNFYDDNIINLIDYEENKLGKNDLYALFLIFGIFLSKEEKALLLSSMKSYLQALNDILPITEAPMRRLLGGLPSDFISRIDHILKF